MKKILLFFLAVGAMALSSCSDDSVDTSSFKYVTISGDWDLHLTSWLYSDSVIKHPNRTVSMNWSDMTYDSTLQQTVVNSQVTIGNGVWRLKAYILGNTSGIYTLQDSSTATYSYTTNPAETDSIHIINYKLSGNMTLAINTIAEDRLSDRSTLAGPQYGDITLDVKAINDSNQVVTFRGTATSALAK